MKKFITQVLTAILVLSILLPPTVFSNEVTKGSLGKDTYWKFDEATGKLTVYGSGSTDHFYSIGIGAANDIENPEITYAEATSFPRPGFYPLREQIKAITVESGVTELGRGIFTDLSNCTSVSLPDTLKIIGDECFYNCSSLKEVDLPKSLTKIGGGTFYECSSLENLVWPPNVPVIEMMTFYFCESLTEFEIPRSVTEIEVSFALGSGIKKIFVPNSVSLSKYALQYVAEEIVLESGFTHLPALLDSNTRLKKLVVPKSVTYIESGFFGTYNSFDFQICYTGTQKELDALFANIDPVLVDQIKMREIVTDYVYIDKDTTDTANTAKTTVTDTAAIEPAKDSATQDSTANKTETTVADTTVTEPAKDFAPQDSNANETGATVADTAIAEIDKKSVTQDSTTNKTGTTVTDTAAIEPVKDSAPQDSSTSNETETTAADTAIAEIDEKSVTQDSEKEEEKEKNDKKDNGNIKTIIIGVGIGTVLIVATVVIAVVSKRKQR